VSCRLTAPPDGEYTVEFGDEQKQLEIPVTASCGLGG
jgi:hypothetical protein